MARKEKENKDAKLMLAAGPKLTLVPTQGEGQNKPAKRQHRQPQMSTWQALASVFMPDNPQPAPQQGQRRPQQSLNADMDQLDQPMPKKYTTERSYFDNGAIRSETPYVNGIRHGKERLYFPDGRLEAEVQWMDGHKDGLEKHFFESGDVKSETNFRLDKRQGSNTEFFPENRAIRHESYYQDDIIDGTEREFYANGMIKTVTQWAHGQRHGISSSFTSDGHIVAEVPYNNNVVDGVVRNYFDNQQLNHETPYKNGVKHGVERCYFDNGNLQRIATYKEGELNGTRMIFFRSGYLESETSYSDGRKNGFDREYHNIDVALAPDSPAARATAIARASSGASITRAADENGRREVIFLADEYKRGLLKHEAFFSHGIAEGIERTFYENGNIEQEWTLKDGFWHGRARKYYESGEVYCQSMYVDGHREGEEKYYHLTGGLKFSIVYDEISRPISGRCVCGRDFTEEELEAFYSRNQEPECDHKNAVTSRARFGENINDEPASADSAQPSVAQAAALAAARHSMSVQSEMQGLSAESERDEVGARSNAHSSLTPEQVKAVIKSLPSKNNASPGFAPGAQVEPVIPFIIQKPLSPSARQARDRRMNPDQGYGE